MQKGTDCFIAYSGAHETQFIVSELNQNEIVNRVFVIAPESVEIAGAETLITPEPFSTAAIHQIAQNCEAEFALLALQNNPFEVGQFALERLVQVAENTGAAMVYADYLEIKNGQQANHPVIDYQEGSLRDDFNFGPVQLFRSDVLKSFDEEDFQFAGYYSLRLHASRNGRFSANSGISFYNVESDTRKSGEKQFDYVSKNARTKQIEMERVCTGHLKKIGAFLRPPFKEIDLSETEFPVEASVIIPVRNRIKTIEDAVESVLKQKTNFEFNLIVVDNHSDDGTTGILAWYAEEGKLIHIVPARKDLGIGGCWNEAVFSEHCGKFAVQLDSDDLYSSENTLQKIVDKFYEEKCAMVIG